MEIGLSRAKSQLPQDSLLHAFTWRDNKVVLFYWKLDKEAESC